MAWKDSTETEHRSLRTFSAGLWCRTPLRLFSDGQEKEKHRQKTSTPLHRQDLRTRAWCLPGLDPPSVSTSSLPITFCTSPAHLPLHPALDLMPSSALMPILFWLVDGSAGLR